MPIDPVLALSVIFSGWGINTIEIILFQFRDVLVSKWLKEKKMKKNAEKYYTFEKKARELQRILLMIQSIILECSIGNGARDEGLRLWLVEIQDKAFDAAPLVENIILGLSQRKSKYKYKCKSMTEDLENFFNELDSMLKNYSSLHMLERLTHTRSENMYQTFLVHTAESSSFIHDRESTILGRVQETNQLIDFIKDSLPPMQGVEEAESSSSSVNNLYVIPIVGICGLGKTTFAREIYNHFTHKSTSCYDIGIWISMHDAFDIRSTTKYIIENANRTKLGDLDLDSLQNILQKLLTGKRFLLVLDGAFHENREDWQKLFAPLHVGKMGTILVTTQSPTVSSIVSAFGTSVHFPVLLPLSKEDCYSLFCQEAFGKGNEPKTELLDISRTIANKCHGLPLVANSFGNMLRLKEDEHEWDSISRTDLHRLPEYDNAIISACRLSFSRFPPHVRKLFPYCAMFPRDFKFTRDYLIRLWMAEGLLNSRSSEERAMSYFQDMEERQLFTGVGVGQTGFQGYQLVGLMYEMAQLLFCDEAFRVIVNKKTDLEGKDASLVRQVSIVSDDIKLEDILRFKKLRTLIILTEAPTIEDIPSEFWKNMKLLTVLDLAGCSIPVISKDIRDLKLLRYLNVSRNPIETLPPAVGELSMLETLGITGCTKLKSIASEIGNLTQLRYLDVDQDAQFDMPSGIGKLIRLHELKRFVLGRKVSPNELQNMAELRVLHVSGLETVKRIHDARQAHLGKKDKLRKLTLQWSGACSGDTITIFPGLQPHKNLKELVIKGLQCTDLMLWDWTSLSSLTHVQLHGCTYLESVHQLGFLPLLKKMELVGNNMISELIPTFFWSYPKPTGYPKLEEISLHGWTTLEKWNVMSSDCTFPMLKTIVVSNCTDFSSFGVIVPNTLKQLYTRGSTKRSPRVEGFHIPPLEIKHFREALKYT